MQERIVCQQCKGLGYTTTQERKAVGRCSSGEMVYSSRTVPINRRCEVCAGRGKVEAGQPAPSACIMFGGHQVDAPGFTAEQFARAIARALVDELEVHERGDAAIVSHKGLTTGYHVTRQRCTCQAGQAGVPCKHRAAPIFHLDVRQPAIRRQWEAARKAVAA